ncbi:hypothetical protein [Kamptonema sp. UHCC 0994]|nr:hypothetical protein [Kamptonema sp. UHCC 0994]MDF0552091.1 hypothetical protein [Kamptonema sp. UHCC 0994]
MLFLVDTNILLRFADRSHPLQVVGSPRYLTPTDIGNRDRP